METGLEVDFVEKRWAYFLSQYNKAKNIREGYRPSGAAAKLKPKNPFKFLDMMTFMKDLTDPTP